MNLSPSRNISNISAVCSFRCAHFNQTSFKCLFDYPGNCGIILFGNTHTFSERLICQHLIRQIFQASELSINPNHWSAEKQGYKPRIALVSDEKRMAFDKAIQEITHLITREYYRGVDGAWLQNLIEEYHHPNIQLCVKGVTLTIF